MFYKFIKQQKFLRTVQIVLFLITIEHEIENCNQIEHSYNLQNT